MVSKLLLSDTRLNNNRILKQCIVMILRCFPVNLQYEISVICVENAIIFATVFKKVQVGKDQEKAQSEKDSHSKNRGGKKTKLTIRYLYHETIVSRMGSYFPIFFKGSLSFYTYTYHSYELQKTLL